jgi:hypothetical protein
MTAKLRGKKRWNHQGDVWTEAMALEIQLDSAHQKIRRGEQLSEKEVSRMLGRIRSILSVLGYHQKTLKRWTKPAPNQMLKILKREAE